MINEISIEAFGLKSTSYRPGAKLSFEQCTPAVRKGKKVKATVETSVTFLPSSQKCKQVIADSEMAIKVADDGTKLFNEGKQNEGIAMLNQALALFPNNANFLYMRGQAYMNTRQMDKACVDFKKVSAMISIEKVEQLNPLVCGK